MIDHKSNSDSGWEIVFMIAVVLMAFGFGVLIYNSYNSASNIKTEGGTTQWVPFEEFQVEAERAMAEHNAQFTSEPFTAWDRASVSKIIDKETGCEYLMMQWNITPRLDASGKPICKGGIQHE